MPTVTQREAARRDLVEHFVYLAENAGLDVAERFLTNAEASFNDLAQQPRIGAPLTLKHPDLANVRKWRVKDFDHHLVFYHRAPTAWPSCACCTPPAIGGACWAWQTSRGRPPSCTTSPPRRPPGGMTSQGLLHPPNHVPIACRNGMEPAGPLWTVFRCESSGCGIFGEGVGTVRKGIWRPGEDSNLRPAP